MQVKKLVDQEELSEFSTVFRWIEGRRKRIRKSSEEKKIRNAQRDQRKDYTHKYRPPL